MAEATQRHLGVNLYPMRFISRRGDMSSTHLDSILRDPHGPLGPTMIHINHDSLDPLDLSTDCFPTDPFGNGRLEDLPTRTMHSTGCI
jgi:hypothetical protein